MTAWPSHNRYAYRSDCHTGVTRGGNSLRMDIVAIAIGIIAFAILIGLITAIDRI